jgi:hypothetical protein
VDHVGIERLFELAGAVVPDRPEQRAIVVGTVAGGLEVIVDQFVGSRVQRRIPCLLALPETLRCGTPRRAWRKFVTPSLHNSSRRSA